MFPLIVKFDIDCEVRHRKLQMKRFFSCNELCPIFRFYIQLRDLAKWYKCNIMRSNLPGTTLALLKLHTLKTWHQPISFKHSTALY